MPGPGEESPHHGFALPFLDVQGLHLTLEAIHHNAQPAPFFFSRRWGLFYFPARSLLGAGEEAHSTFPARGEAGWGVGRKEVRKEPNCLPSSHLCAPERQFRPRTPVATRKLGPFKGTVAARRGGGKDRGSGLRAAGSPRGGERRKATIVTCGDHSLPPPQRPQPALASQGDFLIPAL